MRSAVAVLGALTAAVCCWIASTVTAALALAGTALIVPGTGTQNPALVPGYMDNAVGYYISPTTPSCAVECTPEPVDYLAQFWPFPFEGWGGLSGAKLDVSVASGVSQLTSDLVGPFHPGPDRQVVVFGYSQGATVASRQKSLLSRLPIEDQADLSFVLIGNPNRPNGGLFERLAWFGTVPVLDATFGLPTPTDTGMSTVDVAFQYDGVADFPLYPLNLLATLNAAAGFWYTHGTMLSPNGRSPEALPNGLTPDELAAAIADPANQQRSLGSDTVYITIPTPNLPVLQPLRDFGTFTGLEFLTTPLIKLIQPALRVLIETGYDRSLAYGEPAPLRLIAPINPITLTTDLIDAVGQGVRDAFGGDSTATTSVPRVGSGAPARLAAAVTPATARAEAASRRAIAITRPARSDPARRSGAKDAAQPAREAVGVQGRTARTAAA